MRAEHRLWRTDAGGLVLDGHLDARVLAYAAGDEVSPEDAAHLTEPEKVEASVKPEKVERPKSRRR